jgi:hypothetical protein
MPQTGTPGTSASTTGSPIGSPNVGSAGTGSPLGSSATIGTGPTASASATGC